MADGSTPAAIAANDTQQLSMALQLAHANVKRVDDIIAVVALALRGQGCDQDYACANMLEDFAYGELEQARESIEKALALIGQTPTEREEQTAAALAAG